MTAPDPGPPRACGTCTLCCKVMGIHELEKPLGQWCPHCKPGRGCGVYDARPGSCRTFTCGWLADPNMPDEMRPDRCKVVLYFTPNGERMVAQCDPSQPLAWRREPIYGALKRWAPAAWAQGKMITVLAGDRMWVLTPTREVDLGVVDPEARLAIAEWPDGSVEVKVVSKAEAEQAGAGGQITGRL
jgi:hypothetical protein